MSATEKYPRRWGEYTLVSRLGKGGLGHVDLALSARGEKLCVVKRMGGFWRTGAELADDDEARFRREASIALRLSHGAIAQAFAAGEQDGQPYIVQEFVLGETLALVLRGSATERTRIPVDLAVHIASELARALGYLHGFGDLGLVHRDVTPDNVMLAASGEVKLIDLGLCRATGDGEASVVTTTSWLGRPDWTAPEVILGKTPDRRSDIYSLGVVLWQLLTTWPESPLSHERLQRTAALRDVPPAPSTIHPAVPPELDAVVARALAPDPSARWQSADDLRQALAPFRSATGEPAVAGLVARHTPAGRRQMLGREIEAARRLLDPAAPEGEAAEWGINDLQRPIPAELLPPHSTAAWRYAQQLGRDSDSLGSGVVTLSAVPKASAPFASVAASPPRGRRMATVIALAAACTAAAVTVTLVRSRSPSVPKTPVAVAAASTPAPSNEPTAASLLAEAKDAAGRGDTEAGIRLAREAVRRGGGSRAHYLLGGLLARSGRLAEAEVALVTALQADPTDTAVLDALAHVRRRIGGAARPAGTPR